MRSLFQTRIVYREE